MRIYVASRFSRAAEAQNVADNLTKMGHEVTSRWHAPDWTGIQEPISNRRSAKNTDVAVADMNDIFRADAMVQLGEDPNNLPANAGRGGRHVELGIALGSGKPVVIIGPRETVFHHHFMVFQASTEIEAVKILQKYLQCDVS